MHKNNIAVNELVPKTLITQLDAKIGTWKTTYDIINDAPFKEEPLSKCISINSFFLNNNSLFVTFIKQYHAKFSKKNKFKTFLKEKESMVYHLLETILFRRI